MSHTETIYAQLKDIFFLLDDGDRRLLRAFSLTIPRFHALLHLGEYPGLSASQLCEKLLCDKSNVTRLVAGMERDGLLWRRDHESDGRIQQIYLTPAGENLRARALAAHRAHNEARFSGCLEDQGEGELLAYLAQINRGLQQALDSRE